MKYMDHKVYDIKIAYVGGGSRGWAWGLMSDLASTEDINGEVRLYDIDLEAARQNEKIGSLFNEADGAKSQWNYVVHETLESALAGADFVIISILPGTFEEMDSDVHCPEKYGIFQSVGDTTGPGGIIRAMRTIPMYEVIAEGIKNYCPDAWVINYTNPMTLCVKTLYRVFPQIKAFGCCHEVFKIQEIMADMIQEDFGERPDRHEVKIVPIGVNHFTWVTKATYKNIDLFPYYKEFCKRHREGFCSKEVSDPNANQTCLSRELVKFDLYHKFGWIAAAGDRHLAEFCEGGWYLKNPERVAEMKFHLTPVSSRKIDQKERYEKANRLLSGEQSVKINSTGEEGVSQIRALLGLQELITNVNIPNVGQIPNLPIGTVVETNAVFRSGSLLPLFSGDVPVEIYPLISRICSEQDFVSDAAAKRSIKGLFAAFAHDPLVTCSMKDSIALFREMVRNTSSYLTSYPLEELEEL